MLTYTTLRFAFLFQSILSFPIIHILDVYINKIKIKYQPITHVLSFVFKGSPLTTQQQGTLYMLLYCLCCYNRYYPISLNYNIYTLPVFPLDLKSLVQAVIPTLLHIISRICAHMYRALCVAFLKIWPQVQGHTPRSKTCVSGVMRLNYMSGPSFLNSSIHFCSKYVDTYIISRRCDVF